MRHPFSLLLIQTPLIDATIIYINEHLKLNIIRIVTNKLVYNIKLVDNKLVDNNLGYEF